MTPLPIYVVNRSTVVSDADVRTMTGACATQVARDLAPAWNIIPPSVIFAGSSPVLAGGQVIAILDTLDEADAAGWHTDDRSGVHGVVGAKVWLDHGGHVLTGPDSVSTTLSHEVCELIIDPHANGWMDTGRGWAMALEVCDPVEGDAYTINGASVSNFVTLDYFDPTPTRTARFDQLGRLSRPFTMTKGGYFVYQQEGQAGQKFGEHVPTWKREVKCHRATRVSRVPAAARLVETGV